MSEVLVAVAQFAPGAEDNLPTITRLAERAAARGARLVVFPEYAAWFAEPLDARAVAHAEPLTGPFCIALEELATRLGLTIVAGMLETTSARTPDRAYNTVVAVDRTGVIAVYRKQHLYDAFGERESAVIAPGALAEPETFLIDDIRVGMITCYDLRFPESMRVVVDAGADLVVVPAEWVRGPLKELHWETLLRARAIENTVYVAAADHLPPLGVGRSAVIDPSGISLAELGTEPGIAIAAVDSLELERVRERNPALLLRRYGVTPLP